MLGFRERPVQRRTKGRTARVVYDSNGERVRCSCVRCRAANKQAKRESSAFPQMSSSASSSSSSSDSNSTCSESIVEEELNRNQRVRQQQQRQQQVRPTIDDAKVELGQVRTEGKAWPTVDWHNWDNWASDTTRFRKLARSVQVTPDVVEVWPRKNGRAAMAWLAL